MGCQRILSVDLRKNIISMAGHKTTHTQLERFKLIDSMLNSGSLVPFNDILEALRLELMDYALSDSTLRRDLRYMRDELGAPLSYSREKNGWQYTKYYKLPSDNFSEDEMLFLYLMKKVLLQHSNEDYYYRAFETLLKKINPISEPDNKIYERFYIPNRPKVCMEEDVGEKLFYAIKNNCLLDFTYNSKWEPEEHHRRVAPYQIVIDDGSLFLYGADYKPGKSPRLFKLAKMHNVEVIENQHFDLPDNFRFHEDAEQGRFGAFQYDDFFTFKIEFYSESRTFAREYIWSDNQIIEEDNKRDVTTITFESSQWEPVHKLIMAQCGNAKPLEPDWFVEEWKGFVTKMMKLI